MLRFLNSYDKRICGGLEDILAELQANMQQLLSAFSI